MTTTNSSGAANVMRLLLCSGGLDSLALLNLRHRAGDRLKALFIDYGQLNRADEQGAAREACAELGVEMFEADLRGAFPPSGLTDEAEAGFTYLEGKSRFFLPMRNGVFATLAVSWAMRHRCAEILVGSVRADRTHLDAGLPWLQAMRNLIQAGSAGQVDFSYPLAEMGKGEVMAELMANGIDPRRLMARAYSCYHPRTSPKVRAFVWGDGCGSCLSCRGRRAALEGLATVRTG
jgi:7-cyano-7-deazaguanine synthase